MSKRATTDAEKLAAARQATPDCNCLSIGMPEGARHGLACPYGKRKAAEFIEQQRALRDEHDNPAVEGMTCEEALAEAQAVAAIWQRRAVELGYGSPGLSEG